MRIDVRFLSIFFISAIFIVWYKNLGRYFVVGTDFGMGFQLIFFIIVIYIVGIENIEDIVDMHFAVEFPLVFFITVMFNHYPPL